MVMASNTSFEEQIRKLLAEAKTESVQIGNQMAVLKDRFDILQREIQAYDLVLQNYLKRSGRGVSVDSNLTKLLSEQISQKERLITIAKQEGGRIKISQAANLLYTKGLIKSKSRMNAYRVVYGLLLNMVEEGKFEKIGKAEFRLVGAQVSLLT